MIERFKPDIDDDLSFFNCREPFGIEDLSSEDAIKVFVISILPRVLEVDLDRLDLDLLEPGR